mmetsp:Transcript_1909/g.6823  ORF Transcript_1909/g.6823 Transcript_1909/m.6823 type:complete len:216 (+) Transcript_1909:2739-3386(+)
MCSAPASVMQLLARSIPDTLPLPCKAVSSGPTWRSSSALSDTSKNSACEFSAMAATSSSKSDLSAPMPLPTASSRFTPAAFPAKGASQSGSPAPPSLLVHTCSSRSSIFIECGLVAGDGSVGSAETSLERLLCFSLERASMRSFERSERVFLSPPEIDLGCSEGSCFSLASVECSRLERLRIPRGFFLSLPLLRSRCSGSSDRSLHSLLLLALRR